MAKSKTSKENKPIRGITIGDLHLDKLVGLIPNINSIIVNFCRKLLQQAVDDGYDLAIFLGDTFNYLNASEEAIRLLIELFAEFQHKIGIRVIEGNHGYRRNGKGSLSQLQLLEEFKLLNVWLVTKPRAELINGVPLIYMPHPYNSAQAIAADPAAMWEVCVESGMCDANSYEEADSAGADMDSILYEAIAFAHFTRAGSIRDNGTQSSDGVKYDKKHDIKHYIVGHLHTPQELDSTAYPGTFYQTSFGESEKKGYGRFIAQMGSNNKLKYKYEWVEVEPPIRLVNIIATSERELPKKLAKNTWYKITPMKGFVVPDKIANHPNVTVAVQVRSRPTSGTVTQGDADDVEFELDSMLNKYLKEIGFDEKQLRVANKLFKSAKEELEIE